MTKTPVEFDIKQMMAVAVERKASDIHLTVGERPMLRVYGTLVPMADLPHLRPADTQALARQMIDEGQWERFVETRELDLSIGTPKLARFRVNLYWQRGSVGIALRVIPHRIPTYAELNLPPIVETYSMIDHGLCIITGPTGSGKSTTLAAMVGHINKNKSCHIVTIEDPIEYLHRHDNSIVNQREMYHDTLSFQEALRHVLRQDPDVILIGEMLDLETIQTALTLAETGHLVLATLHTGDTSQAITRIIDVYPPYQQAQARTQLSLVLVGVMAQQLLPRSDGGGRVLAYETLTATPAVRHLIRSGETHQIYSSIQTGVKDGMNTLNSSLLKLYRSGSISRELALQKSARQKELLGQMASYG